MEYQIAKNSVKGETVLDPFCGSGSVGLEAILMGRNFIGYDLNPFAIKLCTSTLSSSFDSGLFEVFLKRVLEETKNDIMDLYRHGNQYILYTVPGLANKQPYNVVLCDYDFQKIGQEFDPYLQVSHGLEKSIQIDIPDKEFPAKFYKDRFSYKGVKKVSDLFSTRNLVALGILRKAIKKLPIEHQLDFTLVLTNTVLHVSKLKSEKIRPLGVNNYWIPDDFIEENVIWRFIDRAKQFQIAKTAISARFGSIDNSMVGKYDLRHSSSIPMDSIDANSIDYILTDPPYGDVIQYSELSFIWNVWLGEDHDSTSELIVNPVQDKSDEYFLDKLAIFIRDCFRVLKPGRKLTLCFQNRDPEVWFKVANIAAESGFGLGMIETFDFLGSTFNKNWAKNSPKVDLYVTLVKLDKGTIVVSNKPVELSLTDLFELVENDKKLGGVDQVHDWYSKVIAIGIAEILKGHRIVNFSKKVFGDFLLSRGEIEEDNAKYIQAGLF